MRPGGATGRRSMAAQVPRAVTAALPVAPKGPANGTGSPLHQKPAGHAASTTVVVESGLYLGPCGADRHVTRPAPGVESCLHHLGHCVRKRQRGLGSPRTACTDVMEVAQSPPLSWEERGARGGRRARETLLYWRRFPALSVSRTYGGL